MGAPKLQNLFKKNDDQSNVGVQEKARLQQLIKKLQNQLENPQTAKKAAIIIEKMIRSK